MHKDAKETYDKEIDMSNIQSIQSGLDIVENDIKEKDKKIFSLKRSIEEAEASHLKIIDNLFGTLNSLNTIKAYCEETENLHVIESIERSIRDVKMDLKEAKMGANVNNNKHIAEEKDINNIYIAEQKDINIYDSCEEEYKTIEAKPRIENKKINTRTRARSKNIDRKSEVKKTNNKRAVKRKVAPKRRNKKKTIAKIVLSMLTIVVAFTGVSFYNSQKKQKRELQLVERNGLYGYEYVDRNFAIDAQFEEAYEFNEQNTALVKEKDANWIIINKNGKVVKRFEELKDFKNGLALVKSDGLYGYIDESGEIKIEPKYSNAYGFTEKGNALAKEKDGDWIVIDKDGKKVKQLDFTEINEFKNGLALVKKDNSYGYIDENGETKIELQYIKASDFNEKGEASVKTKDGKSMTINKNGEEVK